MRLTSKTYKYMGIRDGVNIRDMYRTTYRKAMTNIISYRIVPLSVLDKHVKSMKFRIPLISNFVDKVQDKLRGRNKEKEPQVEQVKLKSSNLDSVAYSEDTKIMQVVFKSGGIYMYYDIPPKTFDGLLMASSKGTFFHKNIKLKNYRFDVIR